MQSKALPLLESAVPTKSRQTRRPRTCNLSTAALLLLGQMLKPEPELDQCPLAGSVARMQIQEGLESG